MGAVGGEHEHAAGAGGKHVARAVDLEPVGQSFLALLEERRAVEERAPGIERAVGLHAEHLPERGRGVRLGHIEQCLVGGEADAVGPRHRVAQGRDRAVGGDPIDAAKSQFAGRIVEPLRQAVGRVGEVDGARGMDGTIIWAVEPLALVVVGDRALAATGREPADAAVAMLAGDQTALAVERETIAAALAAVGADAGEAGRLEVHRNTLALLPAIDTVARDVAEEEVPLLFRPHRPLGPFKPARQHLDGRPLRHERVEPRIEPLDRADGGQQIGWTAFRGMGVRAEEATQPAEQG